MLITTDVALSILKLASMEFHDNPPRLSARDAIDAKDARNTRRPLETARSGAAATTAAGPGNFRAIVPVISSLFTGRITLEFSLVFSFFFPALSSVFSRFLI